MCVCGACVCEASVHLHNNFIYIYIIYIYICVCVCYMFYVYILYIFIICIIYNSPFYRATTSQSQCFMVIGRNGGLSTLYYSCTFAFLLSLLFLFRRPGYFHSIDGKIVYSTTYIDFFHLPSKQT